MHSRYSGLAAARPRPADRIERRTIRPQRLPITYRRVEELKPDPANPRRHNRKQLRQIAESIRVFDFIVPVLTDRDGKIVAGHGRTEAANALGTRRSLRWRTRGCSANCASAQKS